MLGRSANGIFWMFRYLERAESTARLLDAGFQLALTSGIHAADDEWRSILITTGQDAQFRTTQDNFSGMAVPDYMLRGRDNPGSILRMLENARTNARAVRTALTREVWEATNETWLSIRDMLARPVTERNLGEVLAFTRNQAALVRGAMEVTMLRNEIYNFARLGTFLERADNTARTLDVKYYVLLPSISMVGSDLDNKQWEAVLRSLSGIRAYRWLNSGRLDARGITEFLILDRRFPRSLRFCVEKLESNLRYLAEEHGERGRSHEPVSQAAQQLRHATVDQIIEQGLHQFITRAITQASQISDAVAADYGFVS